MLTVVRVDFRSMLKEKPNRAPAPAADLSDPYEERRVDLRQMPPRARIEAIETDLEKVNRLPATAATFHRKKLLRMHDAARLEAGLVTLEKLHRENAFSHLDFSKAQLAFRLRPRPRRQTTSVDQPSVSANLSDMNLQRIKTKLARLNLTKAAREATALKAEFRREDEALYRQGRGAEVLADRKRNLGGSATSRAEVLTVNGVKIRP